MKKNDFLEQAINLLSEAGAQYEIEMDGVIPLVTWWYDGCDSRGTVTLPTQNQVSYRGLKNAEAKWKRDLRAARPAHLATPAEEKSEWREYMDKCFAGIRTEFRTELEKLKGDVTASTDISLDAGAKIDNVVRVLSGLATQHLPTVSLTPEAVVVEQQFPRIAIAPVLPQKAVVSAPKGLDVLQQVQVKQWSDVVAQIDQEFELDDFEGRILFFLYKCGPQTPHDLRVSGVWKGTDPVTRFLEEIECDGLVKFLVAEKKWAITNKGISSLEDDEAEEAVPTPQPTPIAPPRRILEIVPRAPSPVPANLSVIDGILAHILRNGPQTTMAMKVAGLRGYGADLKDVGTAASMAKGTGFLTQPQRGGQWELTTIGRERARRALGETTNNDLGRQFAK
jgi:hypothetical protein